MDIHPNPTRLTTPPLRALHPLNLIWEAIVAPSCGGISEFLKSRGNGSYGFCVGLISTSLTNDCGAWVTSIPTACATSAGLSILSEFFPWCQPSLVTTEPGH